MVDNKLLEGAVDVHVHGSPDVVDRRYTDLELASRASRAGMAGIVLKCHSESTVGRASLASEVTGMPVAGGLVLNPAVCGGIEPDAVLTSLELGARIIWMPTVASIAHLRAFPDSAPGTNRRADHAAKVDRIAIRAVCESVAKFDAVVASGHLGLQACVMLAEEAERAGCRMLLQHPDYTVPNVSPNDQAKLAEQFRGLIFERCAFVVSPGAPVPTSPHRVANSIKAVGTNRNVISSDLGQSGNPAYPDGLRDFAQQLLEEGIERNQIQAMLGTRPARLLWAGKPPYVHKPPMG